VALDLRGHGESDWPPDGSYQHGDFVDDVRAVIGQLGRPPVVVGASLGGITGLLIGGGPDPGVLAGLVLVDVAPRIEPVGVARIVRFMLAHPEGFASLEEAADAVSAYRRHRARPASLAGLRKNLRLGEDGRYRWHWDPRFLNPQRLELARGVGRGFDEPQPLVAAARRLRVPTLLVRGRESDVVSPEGVEEFLEAVPHAAFADVSGAGHMVAGDRNDVFNAAVLRFLREAFS
jgi:pimeloyl-ACP methyl ester carboxylesterase